MNWLKMSALAFAAVGLVACSGEQQEEEMTPEDLPVDQEQIEAAPEPEAPAEEAEEEAKSW